MISPTGVAFGAMSADTPGLRHLSMPPHQLPEIKRVIRAMDLPHAQAIAAEALTRDTAGAVAEGLAAALAELLPASNSNPPA